MNLDNWMGEFVALYEGGDKTAAMDGMYKCFDELLLAGRFELARDLLDATVVDGCPIALLLGVLTLALQIRTALSPAREHLFTRVYERLTLEDPERRDDLLRGLGDLDGQDGR